MRRRIQVAGVALLALAAMAFLALDFTSRPTASPSPLIGARAPRLSGTTLTDHRYTLRQDPHAITVVNIWASWCGPCRAELPLIARVARSWSRRGVRVVTINTQDGPVAARTFLQEVHASNLLTVSDPHGLLAVAWGATGVPETFVVDGNGVVRAHRIGVVTVRWLDEEINRWRRA